MDRRRKNFENAKAQCLGKRDKSFAGRIDVHAVEICSVINDRDEYYTTSSCSGRCFLYKGKGVKSKTDEANAFFERCRISHELVTDPQRYFMLSTLQEDPTGGADPIRRIGQFEHAEQARQLQGDVVVQETDNISEEAIERTDQTVWLRFEPFILHVCCRSLSAARALMAAARPSFKNVGLTTWKESKYLVAIWGDEGLDMPLCLPNGQSLYVSHEEWLAQLVNERHERNWSKIYRFVEAVRAMPPDDEDTEKGNIEEGDISVPKSFDVIGDIALLHNMPQGDKAERRRIGEAIMKKNKVIKLCVARTSNLEGSERAPGTSGLTIIAGINRSPLITTHTEYGTKCVVDLERAFFSPRMGPERIRICQQVARGEDVLVLFAGIGMEALQIASRTEASSVVAVELNPAAIDCARRGHRMLQRSKSVKCVGAADRLKIIEGDVLDILPKMERKSFDRILAPRPKEGFLDGDLGNGESGALFLDALLPLLKEGGECHWYDFCADHEFPASERTKRAIRKACQRNGRSMKVIYVGNSGSVAIRQLRICVDFKVHERAGKNA